MRFIDISSTQGNPYQKEKIDIILSAEKVGNTNNIGQHSFFYPFCPLQYQHYVSVTYV